MHDEIDRCSRESDLLAMDVTGVFVRGKRKKQQLEKLKIPVENSKTHTVSVHVRVRVFLLFVTGAARVTNRS